MTPIPITPQDQPKFPCWLWAVKGIHAGHWIKHRDFPWEPNHYSHYHPDQLEAPEPITSDPTSRAATTAVHCDRCDPSFGCWSSHESPCRKVDTPPTPAGAEELAAREIFPALANKAADFASPRGQAILNEELRKVASTIARHFQPLREELARASRKSISQEEQLKALTKTDCGFGGYIDCLVGDNAALREEVERAREKTNKAGYELERRGQAIADAMHPHRGMIELIPAVKNMADKLTAAEARCKELEEMAAEQVTAMLNKIKVCDQLMLALTDLKKQLDAARQRKD